MKFSPIGIARSNGIQFTIKYSEFLDGKPQQNCYYVQCEKGRADGSGRSEFIFVDTEATHRFPNRGAAKHFCEEIAAGRQDLHALKKEAQEARIQSTALRKEAADKEFRAFAAEAAKLHIDVADLNRLLHKYHALSHDAQKLLLNEEYCASISTAQPEPEKHFDGTCMDVVSPELRTTLCALLKSNAKVLVKSLPDDPMQFIAYAVSPRDSISGTPNYKTEEIPVQYTRPGNALTSTVEGRIAWAEHLHNKSSAQDQNHISPESSRLFMAK